MARRTCNEIKKNIWQEEHAMRKKKIYGKKNMQ